MKSHSAMKKLICEGMCEFFGGCHGPVRAVVVSRLGETALCSCGVAAFEASGAVVSFIYAPAYVNIDNNRAEPDEEVLRNLGFGLKGEWPC